MKTVTKSLISLAVGFAVGAGAIGYLMQSTAGSDASSDNAKKEPLYWVAPMDPNYRRDKPGKSPMGMDLIPFYGDDGGESSPGTVRIDPDVINNLGVTTATVTSSRLNLDIETVGYVQFDENRVLTVSPRVEGWIEKLFVKAVGNSVKAGEPLYSIYSPEMVNAQEELVLASQRGNQVLLDAAEERLRALQVSEPEIKKLKETHKIQKTITVKAKQSGVLDKLTVREGAFVKPSMNLMTIAQLDKIWVIAEVFERQLNQVEVGNKVQMDLEYAPGKDWEGKVDYVYPSLNSKTRTGKIRIHFNNPDAFLRPGMFANLNINAGVGDENLVIPKEALIRMGDSNRVVLALGDGKFKSVNVDVGRLGSSRVEILSGLMAGDEIVTSAQFLIDSESSKSSDFKRMNHDSNTDSESHDTMLNEAVSVEAVWVEATVKSVMPQHSMVTLNHGEIPEWDWPAMTMDFDVADDVELSKLSAGLSLHAEISQVGKQRYQLTSIHIPEQEQVTEQEHNHD
ncbi:MULTISPECIES: efflux RND transporter periplasmic adaptor subunit [Pseudidiomarina]|uniref:Cation efflux system protein CusB n=2 Tax=Pseudidiomarina TaxID=2800384 RepID=A0A6S6WVS8_9GAMM|nr:MULTISPECIES: efflux RND transporter periplasmic adaptor subunit [Pseudidiomarina]VZT41297.1 Cation efflux system protein CusB [Pseudomonas aeruginosa]MDN7123968.1 efflux RND transporter periplasmic adaptor subunit [Pseudidiomarina sp. 1APP75-32.1]MDN7135551.1 efflux RND transporter periplasmic adaptor subunit [Pseudidiomarina sp. 1ASP75-5]MDN7138951.1 efflux RND transporter periplasmic adaptor subunit [Pseudidiomarina sp. 1ASP75-14]MEA3588845.1 efflux RND transporter periplasmic adaptor su